MLVLIIYAPELDIVMAYNIANGRSPSKGTLEKRNLTARFGYFFSFK